MCEKKKRLNFLTACLILLFYVACRGIDGNCENFFE